MQKSSWTIGIYPILLCMGIVIGATMTLTFTVMADGDATTDSVPRTLPYQGVLEFNGEPVHATGDDAVQIMFELYDGQAAETPAYRQPLSVEVFGGRFTATIGPLGTNSEGEEVVISDLIANADDLYLGMTLLGNLNDPEDDIQLSNRQRIHASPYAMWSTTATNFTVANTLRVGTSSRPSTSNARVEVSNNVANLAGLEDDSSLIAFNDYQFLLHRDATAQESIGVGVEDGGSTLFFNTSSDIKMYENGQQRLHLDNSTLRTGSIASSGSISGNFQFTASGEFFVAKDASGTASENMGSTNRRFCFLTRAGYKDIEGGSELAECRVNTNAGQWRVQAIVQSSSDANANCGARCISW